ncbi:DUF2252 domain-containing protein [Paraburkholderia sp. MMS20-SJTN17]|uniref:DUF2252 domain-containing protein n=1 Tax=Paraburkholderia translucens TaxID=2886945 RepID=A0ABS8KC25_9BURK|nr:DUF2252 family protein [Paraburkholderia sp. MMS20-SJTN17]MCC8402319.1 DUF2252 domain-containing protein [Paraburkholderia sp. MMS20-SJTN17]
MTTKPAEREEVARPDERQPRLTERRRLKMTRSAHAYVRGSATRFYAWLDDQPTGKLPDGPAIWIGGDCHIGNLGPIADAEGNVAVQIRDLDQSVIGNPVHDLLRLGLSLTTAARSADLPGVVSSSMIDALSDGYEQTFDDSRSDATKAAQRPAVVKIAMKNALHRSWRRLDRQTIDNTQLAIPLGKRFWPLSDEEREAIRTLFESKSASSIYAALTGKKSAKGKMKVLDAAYWVKGCSSLGRRRYAVLLNVDDGCSSGGPPFLVDIKQAVAAAAPRRDDASIPLDNAKRVVEGARHLSPMLGDRMSAARLDGCKVVIRELMPQDLKFDADRLSEKDAVKAAHFLALVVGRAHAGQMDARSRQTWLTELQRGRTKTRTAPPWLWRSILDLMVVHEADYLVHCRQFALDRLNR